MLALETEFIDWRKFLLAAAQPWPPASKMDLLMTLERCREMGTTIEGRITQEEFDGVCCFEVQHCRNKVSIWPIVELSVISDEFRFENGVN